MLRKRVLSSAVRSMGYDPDNKVLEIEMQSGGIYQYFKVPKRVYEDLKQAASIGRYYTRFVRNEYSARKAR